MALTLFNQLLALPVLYGLYKLYPSVSPMGFDKELPGLGTTILQLLVCLPFAEVGDWLQLLCSYFPFRGVALHSLTPSPPPPSPAPSHHR